MPEPVSRVPGDLWLRVIERLVEPGFAAVIGPVGIYPLRRRQDLVLLRRIREINPRIVFASLSSRYVTTIIHQPREFDEVESGEVPTIARGDGQRFAQRAGLTVAWPFGGEDIVPADD